MAAAQVIQSRAVNNNFEGNNKYFILLTFIGDNFKGTVKIIHKTTVTVYLIISGLLKFRLMETNMNEFAIIHIFEARKDLLKFCIITIWTRASNYFGVGESSVDQDRLRFTETSPASICRSWPRAGLASGSSSESRVRGAREAAGEGRNVRPLPIYK